MKKPFGILIFSSILFAAPAIALSENTGGVSHGPGITLLWIAVILLVAKLTGLVEKIGLPAVLGELVGGIIIGNLVLLGINTFEPIKHDSIIAFLAELGVIILLFQIGLESNIAKMRKVGLKAFVVAIIGVVVPFVLGAYFVGPWLLPGLDPNAYLFLGATLTATSVGITARVFKDLNKLQTPAAQIVLGAAVIDDILGLIILAVISAIVTLGAVGFGTVAIISAEAFIFLIGAIVLGQLSAPFLGKFLSKISNGTGMKLTFAISFCLVLAYLAQEIGLAPIVGAFAAGLVLDPVHFNNFKSPKMVEDVKKCLEDCSPETQTKITKVIEPHEHKHIEDLLEPLGIFLVPIFFVVTGINVKIETLFDPKILTLAIAITAVAFIGKIVSGVAAGKSDRLIVGVGMIPRGEVGLIFASIGYALGVVNESVFSIIVVMVILSTLLTPPALAWLLKRKDRLAV